MTKSSTEVPEGHQPPDGGAGLDHHPPHSLLKDFADSLPQYSFFADFELGHQLPDGCPGSDGGAGLGHHCLTDLANFALGHVNPRTIRCWRTTLDYVMNSLTHAAQERLDTLRFVSSSVEEARFGSIVGQQDDCHQTS